MGKPSGTTHSTRNQELDTGSCTRHLEVGPIQSTIMVEIVDGYQALHEGLSGSKGLQEVLNRLSPVAAFSRQIVVYSYQGILGDMTTNHRKIIPI